MTIIIGILVPAILFLITLPLQSFLFVARQSLKVKEKKEKKRSKGSLKNSLGFSSGTASLRARLGISNKKQSSSKLGGKFNTMKLKAQQQLIRAVSFLISFLRSLASSLICIALSALMTLLPIVIVVIVATSGIMMFLNTENGTLTFGDATNISSDTVSESSSNTESANTTSDKEDVTESKEPVSTEKPSSTESQVSKPEEVVTEEVKGEPDPNAAALDSAGTGDVQLSTRDTPKFINNEDFLGVVPLDVVKKFNTSVQDNILDDYPDLTFVFYDNSTGIIYAKSEKYYFKFTQLDTGFNTSADLKKYVSWWTFD